MKTFVYFLQRGDEVKIGFSANPHSRAQLLRATLIGVVCGGRKLEAQLHDKFNRYALRGEWFSDSRELRRYLRSVSAKENLTIQRLPEIRARCTNCNYTQSHFRTKTQTFVCRKCGNVWRKAA